MVKGYGQYCPLSLAAELLCQRWTLLVVSRVVDGCERFTEIHRGVPQMSPTLLSKRLSELVEAGIVEAHPRKSGRGHRYLPTAAGRDLAPIIDDLAIWGQHWARDMDFDDLDPAFLVWSMHLRLDTSTLPAGRTVLEFAFSGAPKDCRRFWLVHQGGDMEMCLKDPELDVDLLIRSDLKRFVEAWRGFRDLRTEIAEGHLRLDGPPELQRAFPQCLLLSALAPYGRRRPGPELRLSQQASQARG